MSYLKLLPTPSLNLNKATVSVWFRVPKATADAVAWLEYNPDFSVFDGIIPIIVLGTQKQGTVVDFVWTVVGYTFGPDDPPSFLGGPPTSPVEDALPGGSRAGQMAPTFIGVDKDGYIAVHLQTGDVGAASQISFSQSHFEIVFHETDPGFYFTTTHHTYLDTSAQQFPFPDAFGNAGLPVTDWDTIYPSDFGFQLSFDEWHHLLLSWDIGERNASHGKYWGGEYPPGTNFVDATSRMYCAIDDVNKNGNELPGARHTSMEPNDTISYNTYVTAGQSNDFGPPSSGSGGTQTGGPTAEPSYSTTFSNGITADGVFIPSEVEYRLTYPPDSGGGLLSVQSNKQVELAELQIFAGVMIDTSLEGYRRAFIDAEGKPVDPAEAEKLIGRRPDILLHGTSNWIAGRNTGSIGLTRPDVSIPAGQFIPTGKIDPYSPDPSLHGPQGSAA